MIFEKIDNKFYKEDLAKIKEMLRVLSDGKWEIDVRKPRRSPAQNRFIHGFLFEQIAINLEALNTPLMFGKNVSASWSPVTAKEIFFKCLYTGGKKTSECTTKELANAITTCLGDFAKKGVYIDIPMEHKKEFDKLLLNADCLLADYT